MLKLITPDSIFDSEQLRASEASVIDNLMQQNIRSDETVGFWADISNNSVIILSAAIKLGLRVALCPLREPEASIAAWLKSLNVKRVIAPIDLSTDFRRSFSCLSATDLQKTCVRSDVFSSNGHHFSTVIRTSGTSAQPKSAVIYEDAHQASAQAVNDYFRLSNNSCWALSLPLYHVSGLSILFRCMLANASVYIAKNYEDLCCGIESAQISHISLVPAQLRRLLEDGINLGSVQAIVLGGDAVPASLLIKARELALPVFVSYGLTETASMVWIGSSSDECSGQSLSHARLVRGDDDEILIGGASLFAGYLNGDGTMNMPFVDKLFKTGDIGSWSKSNQLQSVFGRKSNRIISGGENIQAEEIEAVLLRHSHISDAVVVAMDDDVFGARPFAFIKWAREPISLKELQHYLRAHVAAYKLPQGISSWPEHAPHDGKKPRQWLANYLKTFDSALIPTWDKVTG